MTIAFNPSLATPLWPPINDAVETYRRRAHAGADPYELSWRLIHVWESAVVFLGAAAYSNYRDIVCGNLSTSAPDESRKKDDLEKWRCLVFGSPASSGMFTRLDTGALGRQGGYKEWLKGLRRMTKKYDVDDSEFLSTLKHTLRVQSREMKAIRDLRASLGSGSITVEDEADSPYSIIEGMNDVLHIRNILAHVPLPIDVVAELHNCLSIATGTLLSVGRGSQPDHPPGPLSTFGVLTGSLAYIPRDPSRTRFGISGSSSQPIEADNDGWSQVKSFLWDSNMMGVTCYIWANPTSGAWPDHATVWRASPFIYINDMLQSHILYEYEPGAKFRFVRYMAEARAVHIISDNRDVDEYRSVDKAPVELPEEARRMIDRRRPHS
jgi:hypothetical protein